MYYSDSDKTHPPENEREIPRFSNPARSASFQSGGGGEQTRQQLILLVEDNADSSNMLKTLLELWNFRVIEARDGEQAIALAQSQAPNLILMDVKLPLMDGVEATRRIREFAPPDRMPVVFISGHAQPGFRTVALAAGGNDYLVKPLDFTELETALGKYIRKNSVADGRGADGKDGDGF